MSAQLRPARLPPPLTRFVPLQFERLDELMQLERAVYPFPWARGNFEDALRSGYSAWTMVDASGAILAYSLTMLAVDEAHLLNLAVAPPWQRRGLAWRMLDWVVGVVREYGARSMLLEVRPGNQHARRLYERYGFRQIGLRRGYYPAVGGREDAIVMRLVYSSVPASAEHAPALVERAHDPEQQPNALVARPAIGADMAGPQP